MKHLNIETVGCFETLLNKRLLLKGITLAKCMMSDFDRYMLELEENAKK